jgi:DNA invertase Pin-like site-specific DNA recombinase
VKVGIYGRVSTADKQQDPESQLLPLREFVAAQNWRLAGEFVDQASAADLKGRVAWRELLDSASKRKVDLILVWRLDRAFHSVLDAANTLERLRGWSVGLRSYSEPWLDSGPLESAISSGLFFLMATQILLRRGDVARPLVT